MLSETARKTINTKKISKFYHKETVLTPILIGHTLLIHEYLFLKQPPLHINCNIPITILHIH